MCEVIFLKVIVYIKREFRCANFGYALCGALGCLLLGLLSFLLGGSPKLYHFLLLPRFAPPPLVFMMVWVLCFLLLGSAFGIAVSPCQCGGRKNKIRSIVLFSLLMLCILAWYPIFFSAGLFWFSLILCVSILLLSVFTLRSFARGNLLAASLMVLPILWFCFSLTLNFCVILLN